MSFSDSPCNIEISLLGELVDWFLYGEGVFNKMYFRTSYSVFHF